MSGSSSGLGSPGTSPRASPPRTSRTGYGTAIRRATTARTVDATSRRKTISISCDEPAVAGSDAAVAAARTGTPAAVATAASAPDGVRRGPTGRPSGPRVGTVEELDLEPLDVVGRREPEDLAVERELRLERADDVRRAPEPVVLAREQQIPMRDPPLPERIDDLLRLRRRNDPVLRSLEDQDRTGDPLGEVQRRTRSVQVLRAGIPAHERPRVLRLELVRLDVERLEVADPVVARPGLERVAERDRGERGVAARAAAADHETGRVGEPSPPEPRPTVDGFVV